MEGRARKGVMGDCFRGAGRRAAAVMDCRASGGAVYERFFCRLLPEAAFLAGDSPEGRESESVKSSCSGFSCALHIETPYKRLPNVVLVLVPSRLARAAAACTASATLPSSLAARNP